MRYKKVDFSLNLKKYEINLLHNKKQLTQKFKYKKVKNCANINPYININILYPIIVKEYPLKEKFKNNFIKRDLALSLEYLKTEIHHLHKKYHKHNSEHSKLRKKPENYKDVINNFFGIKKIEYKPTKKDVKYFFEPTKYINHEYVSERVAIIKYDSCGSNQTNDNFNNNTNTGYKIENIRIEINLSNCKDFISEIFELKNNFEVIESWFENSIFYILNKNIVVIKNSDNVVGYKNIIKIKKISEELSVEYIKNLVRKYI